MQAPFQEIQINKYSSDICVRSMFAFLFWSLIINPFYPNVPFSPPPPWNHQNTFGFLGFFGGGGGRWESKGNVTKKGVNLLYWTYSIMCHIMYQNDLRNISQQNIYLLKVNNKSIRKRREICWTSTIKTPELCHCLLSGIFILFTLNVFHALFSSAFVIFKQENVCWDCFGILY